MSGAHTPPAPAPSALPDVIPSLRGWEPADGAFTLATGARVVAGAELAGPARTLAAELTRLLGHEVAVVDAGAGAGDVLLAVDATREPRLGTEGYELTVGGRIAVVAATPVGALHGTRTVAQLLRQRLTLPAGRVTDVPRYPERGVTLCASQINISEQWIDRLLEEMSSLKLNCLLLELKMRSEAYPQTATWSYYTREQVERLVRRAGELGIDVIPEINSPGHMAVWLENLPELQLVARDGRRDEVRLDITDPRAFDLLTTLIDEYLTVFTSAYWHMGADEYMIDTDFASFPQIEQYARERWGPTATAQDAFVDFVNRVNAHVRSTHGKVLRIWNDGLTGHNVTQELDPDILVEHWSEVTGGPQPLLDRGHRVTNVSYDLYLVRGGFTMDTARLYENGWDVGVFHGGHRVDPHHPGLTGARVSLWPDSAAAQTEHAVEDEMFLPLRYVAQMTWTGERALASYEEFAAVARRLGRPTGRRGDRRPVDEGRYVLAHADGRVLAAAEDGTVTAATDVADVWTLTGTPDGYYRLTSERAGRCLAVVDGPRRLGVPVGIGVAVTTSACTDSTVQRWQLLTSDGGYEVVNACTQQRLAVADGAVVQLPPDRTGDRWVLRPAADRAAQVSGTTSPRSAER